jgi:small subunit ribosomal protein S17
MTAPTQPASRRKTKTGRVVSDKMDKTIVVSVERLARHPLYKRVIRLTTKFKAHDEANDAHIGDTVLIEESRPLSASKRWRLIRVVQRAGDHGAPGEMVADEAAVSEVIHAAAHPGRGRADSDTDGAPTPDADATAGAGMMPGATADEVATTGEIATTGAATSGAAEAAAVPEADAAEESAS